MTDPTYPITYYDYNWEFIIANTNNKAWDGYSDVIACIDFYGKRCETYYKHMQFWYTILIYLRNKSYIYITNINVTLTQSEGNFSFNSCISFIVDK